MARVGNQYRQDSEEEVVLRFWSYVDMSGNCWLWTKAIKPNGYGSFSPHNKSKSAHRAAWEFIFGPIPKGLCVCHVCNNKQCVRPSHLYIDTATKNSADALRDGLYEGNNQGSKHGMAKLTEAKVREIRDIYKKGELSHVKIAKMYGVSHRTIGKAIDGSQWKHVKEESV